MGRWVLKSAAEADFLRSPGGPAGSFAVCATWGTMGQWKTSPRHKREVGVQADNGHTVPASITAAPFRLSGLALNCQTCARLMLRVDAFRRPSNTFA